MIDLHLIPTALREVYTCERCGRQIVSDVTWLKQARHSREWYEEIADWLIYLREDRRLITRCPQHISDRALRNSVRRTSKARRWAREAKERDTARNTTYAVDIYSPYPIHVFDEWPDAPTDIHRLGG